MQQSYPDETWPLPSRFTGLDYLTNFPLAARSVNRIQGVNWLTILGKPLLDEIGGEIGLTKRLSRFGGNPAAPTEDSPVLYPYDGGVVIRDGRWPQLGDRNSGIPESYRIVWRALRDLVFTDYKNKPTRLIRVPHPLDAFEETLGWVMRLDGKG